MGNCCSVVYNYLYNCIYPATPAGASYGYKWQAGQGVPNKLTIFPKDAPLAPGIYVVFEARHLEESIDLFDREPRESLAGPGPVFTAPGVPSPAWQQLMQTVRNNPPPPPDADLFEDVTDQRSRDIEGFLSYVAICLNLIYQIPAGTQLLQQLTNPGRFPVFISVAGLAGNQTFTNQDRAMCVLTKMIAAYERNGTAFNGGDIDTIIAQRYPGLDDDTRYQLLANAIEAAPLYSQCVAENNFVGAFLQNHPIPGFPINGENLRTWLHNGSPDLSNAIRNNASAPIEGVKLKECFLLALIFAIYRRVAPDEPIATPAGQGAGAGINFNVRRADINDPTKPQFRPPAIGLAHELIHAMHYTCGTAPGELINHFTTTAAELLFTGIEPYENEPITENMIRSQWATIPAPGPDASNQWTVAAAARRRVAYDLPVPGQTVDQWRDSAHSI